MFYDGCGMVDVMTCFVMDVEWWMMDVEWWM